MEGLFVAICGKIEIALTCTVNQVVLPTLL